MFKHGNLCSLGIVQPLLGFASHLVVENPAWEAAMPRLWWFTNAPDIKHSQSCCDEPSTLHHILYQHMCSSLTLFSTLGIGNHQHPPCIVQFFYHFHVCRIQELSCYGWAVRPCHEPNGAGNGEAKLIHGFLVWEFDQHTHTHTSYIHII